MKLVYQGPFDAVDIPALGDLRCERGEPVDIPADVAKGLLEQGDNWEKDTPKKSTKKEDD